MGRDPGAAAADSRDSAWLLEGEVQGRAHFGHCFAKSRWPFTLPAATARAGFLASAPAVCTVSRLRHAVCEVPAGGGPLRPLPEPGARAGSEGRVLGSQAPEALTRGALSRRARGVPPRQPASEEWNQPGAGLPAPRGANPASPPSTCLGRGLWWTRASDWCGVDKGAWR